MNTRYTLSQRPEHIPAHWTIYNASRPIWGHITWERPFLSGIFYAAIDPDGEDANRWAERNGSLDAVKVEYVTQEQVLDAYLASIPSKFAAMYEKAGDELRQQCIEAGLRKLNEGHAHIGRERQQDAPIS